MTNLVSIIIPTFNRMALLPTAIQSVVNQSYLNWELLIIDDFSTDATEEVVVNYAEVNSRIKYFKNPIKGVNNARNHGLLKAKGDWIVFLDSDDELCGEMLETHLSKVNSDKEFQISVNYSKVFYEYNNSIVVSDTIYSDKLLLDFLTKKVTWPINAAVIRKGFLNKHDIKFDPNLLNGQDYCFFLSILIHNPKVSCIPQVLSINHHIEKEPNGVKVSAGDTLKYKISRLRSRNFAMKIAWNKLSFKELTKFIRYYAKYQLGLIYLIIKDGFR